MIRYYGYSTDLLREGEITSSLKQYSEISPEDTIVFFGMKFTNGDLEFHLLEEVVKRCKNFIFISSSSVYPFSIFPHKEENVGNRLQADGAIDLALECSLKDLCDIYQKKLIILRLDILMDLGFAEILQRKSIERTLYGSRFDFVSYCTIWDIIRLIPSIKDKELKYVEYNLGKRISTYNLYLLYGGQGTQHKLQFGNTSLNTSRADKDLLGLVCQD